MLRTTQDRLELSEIRRLLFALLLLVVELVLALSEAVGAERGQYGGDLDFLRCHHTPTAAAASNHYIELWTPGALPALARINGLTNNHEQFIDSQGKSVAPRAMASACIPRRPWFPPAGRRRTF